MTMKFNEVTEGFVPGKYYICLPHGTLTNYISTQMDIADPVGSEGMWIVQIVMDEDLICYQTPDGERHVVESCSHKFYGPLEPVMPVGMGNFSLVLRNEQ